MGKTAPIFFIFVLTIITHVSLMLNLAIAGNPKGFTLRMIYKDSNESLFYDPADIRLAPGERFQALIDQSRSRAHYIGSQVLLRNKNVTMNPDVVRVPVVPEAAMWYVGMVGIGTFPTSPPYMNYYLMIDSGSDLTWLQCHGATQTFNQDALLYPWEYSQTYHPLPCHTHPACAGDSCNTNGECVYREAYASGAVTTCVIAKETFSITGGGAFETLQLLMGCGFHQHNFVDLGNNRRLRNGKPDLIAGILGLGRGPLSFINQLGADGQGKFSYCLEKRSENIYAGGTYLSFGADATIGSGGQIVHRTPIVVPEIQFQTSAYYLNLEDITVGSNRVGFRSRDFELKEDGRGGCVIDSGAPYTVMYKDHFDRVAKLVVAYFKQNRMRVAAPTGDGLCFVISRRDYTVPIIKFHFQQQGEFVVLETGFVPIGGNICLAIARSESDTGPAFILGAIQQINKRILYDSMSMTLSFADEIC